MSACSLKSLLIDGQMRCSYTVKLLMCLGKVYNFFGKSTSTNKETPLVTPHLHKKYFLVIYEFKLNWKVETNLNSFPKCS